MLLHHSLSLCRASSVAVYFPLYFGTHVYAYRHACRGRSDYRDYCLCLYAQYVQASIAWYSTAGFKFSWCIGRVLYDACRPRRMRCTAREGAFCALMRVKRSRRRLYAEARKSFVDLRASVLCQRFIEPYAEWCCVDFTIVLSRTKQPLERNTFLAAGSTLCLRDRRDIEKRCQQCRGLGKRGI